MVFRDISRISEAIRMKKTRIVSDGIVAHYIHFSAMYSLCWYRRAFTRYGENKPFSGFKRQYLENTQSYY